MPPDEAVAIFGFLLRFMCALHCGIVLLRFGNLAMCVIRKLRASPARHALHRIFRLKRLFLNLCGQHISCPARLFVKDTL